MDLQIEREYDYTPEGTDIVYHCKALTEPQRQSCFKTRIINDGVEVTYDKERMFRLAVTSIDNLKVNGASIDTAEKHLEEPGLSQYFEEVVSDIMIRTMRRPLKNS